VALPSAFKRAAVALELLGMDAVRQPSEGGPC
jgi:hypothetical protein